MRREGLRANGFMERMDTNRVWLLLKVQMRETFLPSAKPETAEPGKTLKTGGKGTPRIAKRARRSGKGYLGSLVFSWMLIAVLTSVYMAGMSQALQMMMALDLLPLIGVAGASVAVIVTTIYKTTGLLFGFRDYDLVNALPFTTRTVVTCRFMLLYLWNLFFTTSLMIPAGIVYAVFASPTWGFWPVYIAEILLTPLLPCVVAAVIGILTGLIARHFKKRGFVGIILTVAFIVAWMLFVFDLSDDALNQLAAMAPMIKNALGTMYPPAMWAVRGCCDLDMATFALFAGVSVGSFAAFVAIVAPEFKRINAALTASRVTRDYKLTKLRRHSAYQALLSREWKRVTRSSTLFMNACIGNILMVVFAAIILAAGDTDAFAEFTGTSESPLTGLDLHAYVLVAVFFAMFVSMSSTTVSSISLEGKQLWIVKSLPVPTWDVLRSKLEVDLRITITGCAIAAALLWINFSEAGPMGIVFFVIPYVYGFYAAVWGLWLGLKYADFDWTSEITPLKQGKAVMVMTLGNMGIVFASIILTVLMGDLVAYMLTAIMAFICRILYLKLRTVGVRMFDSFGA